MSTTCSDPACDRPAERRGLCQKHYMRWYRHGGDAAPAKRPMRQPVGHRYVRADGYVVIKTGTSRTDYDLEHRVVAAQTLGRSLERNEQVHHLNGVRDDNRPENLEVMTNAEHQRLHDHLGIRTRKVGVVVSCERCGSTVTVKPSKAEDRRFCSNACRLAALHEHNRKS